MHLSTSSVYDAVRRRASTSARTRRRSAGFLSAYSETKTLAEFELAGTDAVILRPHAVYGPGDTTLLPRILAGVRRGRLVLPEGAEVRHSLTHIDNLVLAVRRALDPASPRGTYNIADDVPVLLSAVLREFLERRGSTARLVSIPYAAAFALGGHPRGGRPRHGHAARGSRATPCRSSGIERTLDLTAARDRARLPSRRRRRSRVPRTGSRVAEPETERA